MKFIFTLISLLLLQTCLFSQLVVTTGQTATQLVENVLIGGGVTVSNITFNGQAVQIGEFNGANSNIGFNSGIILSTEDVNDAVGPNDSGGEFNGLGGAGDVDLDLILAPDNVTSNDAAVLEFDFIPVSDTITFNYVFASEEYLEYVATINDIFGFFISGPGISGPFSNNSKNIAIIPGTNSPVSIQNINDAVNPQLYVDNETPPGQTVQFDGFTVPLQAKSAVQCGETYHLKIVIADAFDDVVASGVFLEAGSLQVNEVTLNLQTLTGDTIVYEGTCTSADFILVRPGCSNDQALTLDYTFSGTATENVDYTISPAGNSITFAPFQDTIIISITGLVESPNVIEVDETIIFTGTYTNITGGLSTISGILTLSEEPIIGGNTNNPISQCPNDSILTTIQAVGGTGPYTYTWDDGQVGDSAYFNLVTPGNIQTNVLITDFCGFSFIQPVSITYPDLGILSLNPDKDTVFCSTANVVLNANATNGLTPYTYVWSNSTTGPSVTSSISANNTTNSFNVTVTDGCGFTAQGLASLTMKQTLFITNMSQTASSSCLASGIGNSTVVGITGTPTYAWNGPGVNGANVSSLDNASDLASGWYYFSVSDNVCQDNDSVFVAVLDPVVASFTTTSLEGNLPLDVFFTNNSQNADDYFWEFNNGQTLNTTSMLDQIATYSINGTYEVYLVAYQGTCTDTAFVTFTVYADPVVLEANIFTPNGDNTNEYYTLNPQNFASFSYQIFNRWGNLLFEGDLATPNWHGILENNKIAEPGVYFYKYSGIGLNKAQKDGQGFFHLVK